MAGINMVKMPKKRGERVKKIIYEGKGISEYNVQKIKLEMRHIRHFSSVTSITLNLEE